MPRRDDLRSILVIGSGPIVIGQACEFDYSGTQACRVLLEEGYRVILANSNPATIMTDPAFAHRTYIEPLTAEVLEAIIERERPDAVLPTLGGQTALNLAMALHERGTFDRFGVEMIGASAAAIATAEDRERFKAAMTEIGLAVPESGFAYTLDDALEVAGRIGYPLIVRPSYILGGAGTGVAVDDEGLTRIAAAGLAASPISEILIERSIAGWKEYELEVMRDRADNCVVICSIENFDPMGVHTGDSITVAPAQTLSDHEYQRMRDAAFACIRRIGVETGGSNIQFAVDPVSGDQVVIEMNPRVSRSSALASKATGFPDRQDRRPPGGRLHPRRDPQRHHRQDAGLLRTDHRLRGDQDPPLGLREVSRHPRRARDPDAVRRARPWRSGAPSASRCRRGSGRSNGAGSASTAIPPRPSTTAWDDDELVRRAAIATPDRPFHLEAALRRGISGRADLRGDRCGPLVPGPDRPDRRRAARLADLRRPGGRWSDRTGAGPSGWGSRTPSWPGCGRSRSPQCAACAARVSAATSRRLSISFSAFRTSTEAPRTRRSASSSTGVGRARCGHDHTHAPCPANSRCSAARACSSVSPTSHPCRSAIA